MTCFFESYIHFTNCFLISYVVSTRFLTACQLLCYYWSVAYIDVSEKFWYIFRKQYTSFHLVSVTIFYIQDMVYYPTKFNFLLWIHTWIKSLLASCKINLMCLHIMIRDRIVSEQSAGAVLSYEYVIYRSLLCPWYKWQVCVSCQTWINKVNMDMFSM